ncbi:hypothetical protein [Streptomyces sporangiiformans]|uniref:Uncharacterized protein n=1 Tax=Streptomyces sporangiiformans TaxID=2315329 RepID=A0A505DNK3_9ACTN|nr:hypothetical protein [Streptomyces sporangiiformans]TPQ22491.1 hypothetical protein FGD71_009535 [Streptomyces sporangiiformans]
MVGAVAHEWNRLHHTAALWLRLVPPYGYLGAAPWEEELARATRTPLMRVPDRLPAAADPGRVWSLAIAVNAAPESVWSAPYVESFLDALHRSVRYIRARIDVHVFADATTYEKLRELLPRAEAEGDPQIHLHDPSGAWQAHEERTERGVPQFRPRRGARGRAPSPQNGLVWADWIAEGLDGRAVRALHVITDAVFDGDRPLLRLSPDPGIRTGPSHCTYVTGDRVRLLADTIGASVLSFGSPPDNPGDAATRVLADGIGLQRSGPTFYSSLTLDPEGLHLAHAHAFVADPRGRTPIPRYPSLFAYLQPEHVEGPLRRPWIGFDGPVQPWLAADAAPTDDEAMDRALMAQAPDVSPGNAVRAYYASSESVPGWVAASERYIDAQVARLVQTSSPPDVAPAAKQSYDLGTAEALSELRDLVARHVRPS